MTAIGFHASHEQFSPSFLLRRLKRAEQAGFSAGSCSDHFHPWSDKGGESGFAWSWLGSALEATTLSLGTVTAPGQRYHPAVIAQAAATLAEMYPGRFWLALGSGENLNEHITGARWPEKDARNQRLKESFQVIRALWAGETVTHRGAFVVDEAKLYTLPSAAPLLFGAALTPATAEFLGGFADGLITAGRDAQDIRRVVTAFKEGGGAGKPMYLQVAISFAETEDEALASIHEQWRVATLSPLDLADIKTPALFDSACGGVQRERLMQKFRVSADWRQHLAWLRRDMELGFDAIFLNHVGRHVDRFIDMFGASVIPEVPKLTAHGGLIKS